MINISFLFFLSQINNFYLRVYKSVVVLKLQGFEKKNEKSFQKPPFFQFQSKAYILTS